MTNKSTDVRYLMDALTDFSENYGDQELISTMKVWLMRNMGGTWVIDHKDSAIDCGYFKALIEISKHIIEKLEKTGAK